MSIAKSDEIKNLLVSNSVSTYLLSCSTPTNGM